METFTEQAPLKVEQRLLQTLVPVNALTVDHLNTLLRDQSIEVLCQGQKLFEAGEHDGNHVYLLSGRVSVWEGNKQVQTLDADDPECL